MGTRSLTPRSPAGRAAARPRLSVERVKRAALKQIERDGLAAFSLRRIASELRCEPMSLYHYFPSKGHLLDALVDDAMASVVTAPRETDPFERLRLLAYSYRAMAHRHPKLFQLVAVHRLNTPTGVKAIDQVLALARDAVGDERLAAQYFRVFGYYLTGAALDETAGYALGPSAAEPVTEAYVDLECPRLAAAAPYFKPKYWDSTFELGLVGLLAAMRAHAKGVASAAGVR